MKPHARWIAVLLAILSLSVCYLVIRYFLPVPVRVYPAREAAAVKTRWIGMTPPESRVCPVPSPKSSWTGGPLFSMQGVEKKLEAAAHQAGLDQFCVYDYHGTASDPELPHAISARLVNATHDEVGMASMAGPDPLAMMIWEPFYQRFSYQVQALGSLPVAGSPVRLALLDTQPDGEGVPSTQGRSDHGYALLHMAGGMACKLGVPCPVEIASRLALPLETFDAVHGKETANKEQGGFRGTFAELSQALWNEIKLQLRPERLVLNLSLGWDGEKLGGWEQDPAAMTPDVQAVYRALDVAAGQDVLVIAAAGNELSGFQATEKPLLPAGWASRVRPGNNVPLVYAVSGVDGRGHPLVSTRTHGEASLVAYADHAVAPDFYGRKQHTATLTGTSVAAAVASTAAALVWSEHPGWQPAAVIARLAQTGDDLGRVPDFPSHAATVHRISLCKALNQPCTLEAPPSLEPKLSDFQPQQTLGTFGGTGTIASLALNTPKLRNLLDQPWVGPQPGVDPCPNCAVTGPPDSAKLALPAGTGDVVLAAFRPGASLAASPSAAANLRIEIPCAWAAGTLQGATLEVFDIDSQGRKQPRTGCSLATSFIQGSTLEVSNSCLGEVSADTQARLSFVLAPPPGSPPGTDSLIVDSPLFVEVRPWMR